MLNSFCYTNNVGWVACLFIRLFICLLCNCIGTPMQNGIEDLEALFNYLRLTPFVEDSTFFKKFVTRPIKSGELVDLTLNDIAECIIINSSSSSIISFCNCLLYHYTLLLLFLSV